MPRTHLDARSAPAAIGPYSHGVWAGELLYLSGQTPIDPATGRLIDGDVQAQTHRYLTISKGRCATQGFRWMT